MELVVDLLQSVLDLLTDHWINISIISQFYSNVFYFLDHSLLNSLLEMIKEQNFVTSQSGPVVRAHLNMLEGWACGNGLKEEVLENLARLSAAADLLATEEAELVQVSIKSVAVSGDVTSIPYPTVCCMFTHHTNSSPENPNRTHSKCVSILMQIVNLLQTYRRSGTLGGHLVWQIGQGLT